MRGRGEAYMPPPPPPHINNILPMYLSEEAPSILKIGPRLKKFTYSLWETAKVGWVVDFLLRVCLKIGCSFTFHEIRLIFLAEIEL